MADKLVEQWLNTERQVTRLETDWQTQSPMLVQRVALLKAEKTQLQNMLKDRNNSQDAVAERRVELLAKQTQMEAGQIELQSALHSVSKRLDVLSVLLPPPLQSRWHDEQASLGSSPEVSVQLQVALAQIALLADFDQRISVHEMPIALPDGGEILVKQLYLGLGSAWFVSRDGKHAGSGQATPEGWIWNFDDSVDGSEIAKAIAVFEKQQEADFVHLPLRISTVESL